MNSNDQVSFDAQREHLLATQDELTRRLGALQRDTSTALNNNFAEQATQLENRDVVLALGDEARAELADVRRALRRMDDGGYGECVHCGQAIATARLRAYPAAVRCIGCANADE